MGSIYTIPAFSRVQVPASVADEPGIVTARFAWPRRGKCTGVLLVPHDGEADQLGLLGLLVLDENGRQVVSDLGSSVPALLVQPHAAPCMELFSRDMEPFKLQRIVRTAGDEWVFSVHNYAVFPLRIASLAVYIDEEV